MSCTLKGFCNPFNLQRNIRLNIVKPNLLSVMWVLLYARVCKLFVPREAQLHVLTWHKFPVTNPQGGQACRHKSKYFRSWSWPIPFNIHTHCLLSSSPCSQPSLALKASHLSQSNYRIIDWQAINTFLSLFPPTSLPHPTAPLHHIL